MTELEEQSNHFNQTELEMDIKLEPPYNGLFFCRIRENFFRWPEYISFYKRKRI